MSDQRSTRGWIVVRVFLGLVFLLNGVAKLTPLHQLDAGPLHSMLYDYGTTEDVLVQLSSSSFGWYHDFVINTVVPHYELFGRLLAAAEIAIGLGLTTGILGRVAALGGAVFELNLQVAGIGDAGGWTFDYLILLVPLVVLVFVPSSLRLRRTAAVDSAVPAEPVAEPWSGEPVPGAPGGGYAANMPQSAETAWYPPESPEAARGSQEFLPAPAPPHAPPGEPVPPYAPPSGPVPPSAPPGGPPPSYEPPAEPPPPR